MALPYGQDQYRLADKGKVVKEWQPFTRGILPSLSNARTRSS
jgi:hypothetical protein